MRKTDLHPLLQATCVPIPGHGGCYAVMPPPVPISVDVPDCHHLFALASRELELLSSALEKDREHADLLLGMLNRREAVDSSQIEGTKTGFDGLLLHELQMGTDDAAEDADAVETFAYVRAFLLGSETVERLGQQALSHDLICRLHAQLMENQPRCMPGKLRQIQNYVGLRLETARYVPPPAEAVAPLLADLEHLLQYEPDGQKEVSILMRAAIAHAQFEAIHPFLDGNGRTGRLLLPLIFQAADEPPIHLATFLKVRQQEYYDALWQAQVKLNWAPWMRLFLESVIASCRHTVLLLETLRDLQTQWKGLLNARRRRKDAAIWRLLDLLLGQPLVTVTEVARRLEVSFPAANQAVDELVELDVLRPMNAHKRHRVFQAHQVTNALYTGLDAILDKIGR
jgi:Fic family protein